MIGLPAAQTWTRTDRDGGFTSGDKNLEPPPMYLSGPFLGRPLIGCVASECCGGEAESEAGNTTEAKGVVRVNSESLGGVNRAIQNQTY